MLTIFLEHKGAGNMPGESQDSFFHISIKREHLYVLRLDGRFQFIEGEVPPQ